jgi:hypothetical protein
VLPRFAARLIALAFIGPVGLVHGSVSQGLQYQADIQIKTLEITKSRTSLSVRVVIYSENNDGGTGIGLTNLSKQLLLLIGKDITVTKNDEFFIVEIPLINPKDEGLNS